LAGGNDFFRTDKQGLLYYVQTLDDKDIRVEREAIGISEELEEKVWAAHHIFIDLEAILYDRAARTAADSFPDAVKKLVKKQTSGAIRTQFDFFNLLRKNKLSMELLKNILSIQDDQVRKLFREDQMVFAVLRELVKNLRLLYETAKEKNRNIYHY